MHAEGLAADATWFSCLSTSPPYSLRMTLMIFLPLMLLWAPRPLQFATSTRWVLLLFFAAVLTIGTPNCLGIEATERDLRSDASGTPPADLSREGTRVTGLVGSFREVGRRWTFLADENQVAYRLLENQSLERVCRAIGEDPQDTRWKISGELTEFMDENFLLLRQTQRASH